MEVLHHDDVPTATSPIQAQPQLGLIAETTMGTVNADSVSPEAAGRQETSFVVTEDDPLSLSISRRNKFIVQQTQSMGCCVRPTVIKVLDENGDLIFSTMMDDSSLIAATYFGYHAPTTRSTAFMDVSGGVVIEATETGSSLTVTSGDRMLGIVDGCAGLYHGTIVPKNHNGVPLCKIQEEASSYRFLKAGDGDDRTEIGRAILSDDAAFEVRLSPDVDTASKALLLVAAYALFYRDHLYTPCGGMGSAGTGKISRVLKRMAPFLTAGVVIGITIICVYSYSAHVASTGAGRNVG